MTSLRASASVAGALGSRRLCTVDADFSFDEILSASWLDQPVERLRGRSILIATKEQLATACALIACDGVARRMVICPPDLSPEHLAAFATLADVDAVLCDDPVAENPVPGLEAFSVRHGLSAVGIQRPASAAPGADSPQGELVTEWVMPTSGTSGVPKLVIHTLHTLVGAIKTSSLGAGSVWSTFYDIRRYGGLQIFLRATIAGGSLVLSSATESTTAFLERMTRHGVTHISGTPSHWRRALMSPACALFIPHYVRLSGEIADQAILDRLQITFPNAVISHAFASTEAGVAFDVADGLAGFPAALIDSNDEVAMRVEDGSLRIKSSRNASRYLDEFSPPICDEYGFVDTGDIVELHEDRYMFVGRRSGIINVGGLKIHPEEVEAVIAEHPHVRMCVVKARKSPITGAVVTAEIVTDDAKAASLPWDTLRAEITALCQQRLARHKVPVSFRHVSSLDMSISGKMRR